MSTSIVVALASFIGMATLLIRNVRRIENGNIHELHPFNVVDLVRPSIEVWKNAIRGFGQLLSVKVLKWSQSISFALGKKLLAVAWAARGKSKEIETRPEGAQVWREVAYEKERIAAHFSRAESAVR